MSLCVNILLMYVLSHLYLCVDSLLSRVFLRLQCKIQICTYSLRINITTPFPTRRTYLQNKYWKSVSFIWRLIPPYSRSSGTISVRIFLRSKRRAFPSSRRCAIAIFVLCLLHRYGFRFFSSKVFDEVKENLRSILYHTIDGSDCL